MNLLEPVEAPTSLGGHQNARLFLAQFGQEEPYADNVVTPGVGR
jgi:hypothetical protein